MSLSPEVIDAMVANGATVEMMAAIMKAELAAIERQRAEEDAEKLARRSRAAEKKRRQRTRDVPACPPMSPDVPGTDGDVQGQSGTSPKTKVSPTPPSKTQTPKFAAPIVAPAEISDGSAQSDLLGGGGQPAEALRMGSDVEFGELWDAATQAMRKRGKSRETVWKSWKREVLRQRPKLIVAALRRYVTEDEDVKSGRGQPGLHRWLNDHAYDAWLGEASAESDIPPDRWRKMVRFFVEGTPWAEQLGPPPDRPGCRAPPSILAEFNFLPPTERTAA